ncbi:MAG: hypothetical protein NC120_06275 [Ruminococcus sp.]|nr:hypothetical protein [Ruminococcus sp.]
MKNLTKTLAAVSSLVLAMSSFPAVPCNAYSGYTVGNAVKETTAEFAVVMWTEKDGELTITGCMPMTSTLVSDYPTSNIVSVFVYNGKLELPSHINGKAVTAIKGYNITAGLNVKSVTVNENIDIGDKAIDKDISVILTDKEIKLSPVYYYTNN